ncbi:hypothetical protein FQZ97_608660 [compost metagenome]
MCVFSAVTSISERCTSSVMRSRFGSMPTAQWSLKLTMPSASRRTLCRKLCATIGRNTFSSKLPEAPPMLMATSFPNTCAASIVTASLWVGLTLPGMIDEPGSFSGMLSSPMPLRGPLASQRTSLAILFMLAASVLSAPWACTSASTLAMASNLFGAVTNGRFVSFASSAATCSA